MLQIVSKSQPVANEDIIELEEYLSVSLPDAYKEFLLRYNGGVPTPNCFRWRESSYQDSTIRQFFHIWADKADDIYSIEWNCANYQNDILRIPGELLAIGSDTSGNNVCIGIRGEAYSKIFFWDHEKEGTGNLQDTVTLVSESFDAFLNSLQSYETDQEDDFWFYLSKRDYEAISKLFQQGLSSDHVLKHHKLTLLEYSCMYHDPILTELILNNGAHKDIIKALEIAKSRSNEMSAQLIQEVINGKR